jgi:hypothetical protein
MIENPHTRDCAHSSSTGKHAITGWAEAVERDHALDNPYRYAMTVAKQHQELEAEQQQRGDDRQ